MTTQSDSFSDAKELSRLDDPIVWNRCVKLKRRSGLETSLFQIAIVLLVATCFLLTRGYFGTTSRSGRHYPPSPALIPFGMTTLGIALAMLVGFLCCRNRYLLDPTACRLYHQFQFLWWRRRRLAFRQDEILGLTTEGRMKRSKYSTYWVYRLTAVGLDGRQEPLTNWRRNGLEMWNAKARELAAQLGCQSYAAPAESVPSVEQENGKPVLRFDSPPSMLSRVFGRLFLSLSLTVFFVNVVMQV
jgi:hypothetical protein